MIDKTSAVDGIICAQEDVISALRNQLKQADKDCEFYSKLSLTLLDKISRQIEVLSDHIIGGGEPDDN